MKDLGLRLGLFKVLELRVAFYVCVKRIYGVNKKTGIEEAG